MLKSAAGFLLLSALPALMPAVVCAADLDNVRDALDNGAYQQALTQVNDYLDAHPGDTRARFLHGLALARAGQTDAAIEVFSALAEDYPDLAQPRNNLGVLYAHQRRYEDARKVLEQAVRINPEHAPAQENLGDVYVSLARRAYDRAAQLEQTNTAVRAKRQRLQALLDSPDTQTIVKSTPAQSASPGPTPAAPARTSASARSAAAPTAAATGGAQQGDATRAAVASAVRDWAKAWSDQDIGAYLAAYSKRFDPPGDQSRSAWQSERRARVSGPDFIRVDIDDVQVQMTAPDTAVAQFQQRYRSGSYHDRVRKTLRLRREDAGWRIVEETSD